MPAKKKAAASKADLDKATDKGVAFNIKARMPKDDQIAAIREQIEALSKAAKVDLVPKFANLVAIANEEKAKGNARKASR